MLSLWNQGPAHSFQEYPLSLYWHTLTITDHFGFHSSFTIASVAAITVTFICSFFLWGSGD
jgi:hypothetical protein